jgi:hypothetical protein
MDRGRPGAASAAADHRFEEENMSAMAPPIQAESPAMDSLAGLYKGLDYFCDSAEDVACFAGRAVETRAVVARITTGPYLVLYGRSGLGKTSLLRAGVFPELRKREYLPVYVRTLVEPLQDLAQAIREAANLETASKDGSLQDVLKRACEHHSLVIVLDQFEEFFIRHRKNTAFVEAVVGVIRNKELDVRFVFSLREDYLAALDDFQRYLDDLFVRSYRLLPLTTLGAYEAITQPLYYKGVSYDERMVTTMVDELAKFDFDSARLQIACSELCELAVEKKHNTLGDGEFSDLEKKGGLEQVFYRYVERVVSALDSRIEELARVQLSSETVEMGRLAPNETGKKIEQSGLRYIRAWAEQRSRRVDVPSIPDKSTVPDLVKDCQLLLRSVLDALITDVGTKRALSRDNLLQKTAEKGTSDEPGVDYILNFLEAQRLLRREWRQDEEWVELIHECLVHELQRWLRQDTFFADFCVARDLIENSTRSGQWKRRPELLLTYDQIEKIVSPFKDRIRPTIDQVAFLAESGCASGHKDARFWAQRYDLKKIVASVRERLSDPNPNCRRAALQIANQFADEIENVSNMLRQLCIRDPDWEVRRAAGAALAAQGASDYQWLKNEEELSSFQDVLGVIIHKEAASKGGKEEKFLLSRDDIDNRLGGVKERLVAWLEPDQVKFVAFCAIYRGARDSLFWAEHFRFGGAVDWLIENLKSTDPVRRENAVDAAEQLWPSSDDGRRVSPAVFEAFWDLATQKDDGQDASRTKARRVLLEIAKSKTINRAEAELKSWRVPHRVQHFIATIPPSLLEGHRLSIRAFYWHWRLDRVRFTTVRRENRVEIERFSKPGVNWGFLGALAWVVTGLPAYFKLAPIFDGLFDKGNKGWDSDDAGIITAFLAVTGIVAGLPLGRSIALKGRQSFFIYGPDAWNKAVLACPWMQWSSLVLALITSFALASHVNYRHLLIQFIYFIAPLLFLPVFWWIVSKTVHWLCVARANTKGKPRLGFILYVCVHTFWMGLSMTLAPLVLGWEEAWLLYLWVGLFGYLQIVCSITLACSQAMIGAEASYNELSRLRIRSRLKTATIISIILWLVIYFYFRPHAH